MNVSEASALMRPRLAAALGAREGRATERIIFEEMMNLRPVDVAADPERELPEFMEKKLRDALLRIEAGEPVQYVMGRANFCGLELKVTPATLIPRPETEELVDMIVSRYGRERDLRVLDVGTGSGCIAIALARALKFARVTAVDNSGAALKVARENARTFRVNIDFVEADALNLTLPGPQDIIVSNPPYVLRSEAAEMEKRVLDHEPHAALFVPDENPMRFYDAITAYARKICAGALYYEINPLCAKRFGGSEIIKDMHGRDRFAVYDPLD